MPATSTYSPTGNPYVDGMLSGIKWAVTSFTFSFPTDPSYYGSGYGSGEPSVSFEAFNAVQQSATRAVLDSYEAITNLSFTEIAETSSQHADLRYAESGMPSTAWAYYPTTNPAGGDSWFSHSYYNNPVMGTYAYAAVLHETGHALGLKHPHESGGGFNALPVANDSLEYSVMSYRSYVGASTSGGYTNGSTSYPQTLMMYDIVALQTLYGADYTTNGGNTVYAWNSATSQMTINGVAQAAPAGNKVFMTLWDGGGNDTYDFSNYTTNLQVSLEPGQWSTASTTQLASLGSGHVATGNIANALLFSNNPASLIENAIGGTGSDTIVGNTADNRLTGGGGNDTLDGAGGANTAIYSGLVVNYLITDLGGSWTVADLVGADGLDTMTNIQFLQFSDQLVALDEVTTGTPDDPVNSPPVANNDSYKAVKKTQLVVSAENGVLANDLDPDGDQLSAILVSGTSKGTLTLNADGSFIFMPKGRFTGTTTFKYKVTDGESESAVATATIKVSTTASAQSNLQQIAPSAAVVSHDDAFARFHDQMPDPANVEAVVGSAVAAANASLRLIELALFELDGGGDMSMDLSAGEHPVELAGLPDCMQAFYSEFAFA